MPDYTPGPWEVEVEGDGIETTACGPIKTLFRGQSSRDLEIMRAEAIANARLIAAAPELLEALAFFLGVYMLKSESEWTDYCEAAERARVAVYKALHGEPPAQDPDEPRAEG